MCAVRRKAIERGEHGVTERKVDAMPSDARRYVRAQALAKATSGASITQARKGEPDLHCNDVTPERDFFLKSRNPRAETFGVVVGWAPTA